MTIKQRIFFSNMVMFLFLLFYTMGLLWFSINSLTESYQTFNDNSNITETAESLSAFEIQNICESFTEHVRKTGGNIESNEKAMKYCRQLSSLGTKIMVAKNDKAVYITEGYKYDTLLYEAERFYGSEPEDRVLCVKENGFLFISTFEADGEMLKAVLLNEKITVSETSGLRGEYVTNLVAALKNDIQSFTFLGVMIIIIINLVLVTVVTNSIMKPLNLLKEGAQKIVDGDLNFSIEYGKEDEISEVLEAFEQMRRQLRQSTEEQKKYEDNRKRLIAGISHDLRTPLTSIKGYVSGLLDGIADTDEKKENYLRTIYNTADDMGRLVDDLFLFSKLDMDKIPFSFEEVEIGEYMDLFCDEVRFSLDKRKVLMTYTNLCGGPVYIKLDRNNFARVLLNITDNTVKYKKNEIGNLQIIMEKKEEFVEIRLKDDGIGVENSKLGKIFESFYRSDPARTNPVKGTGLGLAIAEQIVEAHGGKIHAESNLGEGLTIVIDLPYADDKQPTDR